MPSADDDSINYRPTILASALFRTGSALSVGLGVAAIAWTIMVGPADAGLGALVATPMFVAFGILLWRMAEVGLRVSERDLTIVNIVGIRRLQWDEIDRFDAGRAYWGISAVLRDGGRVTINAIQKSNIASATGTPTRADEVATELNRLLASRRDRD